MSNSITRTISKLVNPPPLVTVIRLSGVIGSAGRFGRSLEDAQLAEIVERAFKPSRLCAVALAINSPGGSPAQSALIANRIRDHAEEKGVPVLAFVEDVAASGGYFLACAADEIYAEENSIIGSIGVISASFGMHEAIEKLGIERRIMTAGKAKSRLDPFQPLKAEDTEWLKILQEKIHRNFIRFVKRSRGKRIAEAPKEIFTGEIYVGEDAEFVGLIDGIGRLRATLRDRFGKDTQIRVVSPRRGMLERFAPSMSHQIGAGLAEASLSSLEERALWAKYGL
ncbi:MAG: S49 family peptidase [Neomegalonema sp.]|nr:S49 family peptidase [Neomegalonema sp.]